MLIPEEKECPRCLITKPKSEWYTRNRKTGPSLSSYCKKCSNDVTVLRQRAFKQKCVDYKGGKCNHCGYSKSIAALEFHHEDPTQKDFTIASSRLTAFSDKIKQELDKCLLLCANCHREEHERLTRPIKTSEESSIQRKQKQYLDAGFIRDEKTGYWLGKCNGCGGPTNKTSVTRCRNCYRKEQTRTKYPPLEQLLEMIKEQGYSKVGRTFGVSDNAVRKAVQRQRKAQKLLDRE